MRFPIISFTALAVIGVSAGYFLAEREVTDEVLQRGSVWRVPEPRQSHEKQAEGLLSNLRASKIFPPSVSGAHSDKNDPSNSTNEGGEDTDKSDFPLILTSSRLDGVLTVQLRLSDGRIKTARKGDTLESGWTIVDLTLEELTAEQDGERITRFVVEKPDPSES